MSRTDEQFFLENLTKINKKQGQTLKSGTDLV